MVRFVISLYMHISLVPSFNFKLAFLDTVRYSVFSLFFALSGMRVVQAKVQPGESRCCKRAAADVQVLILRLGPHAHGECGSGRVPTHATQFNLKTKSFRNERKVAYALVSMLCNRWCIRMPLAFPQIAVMSDFSKLSSTAPTKTTLSALPKAPKWSIIRRGHLCSAQTRARSA